MFMMTIKHKNFKSFVKKQHLKHECSSLYKHVSGYSKKCLTVGNFFVVVVVVYTSSKIY